MSDIAIRVNNLSKAYQLGDFGTGTLSRDIERWWALIRGKEDPFLKVGEVNDRTSKGESDIVWSLKDINFDIKAGDAVGIIGRNGAGKSTLLKVLSRVTAPTTGNIKVKGRIASLLEVGTGFHPELTGSENIYLNGAIMGMSKREIKRKFDEIVDFAGVERYVDTPVKRYSSGMYVRLAFAVAAHLESEILIVDEVLAVGDAEFQKKCIGKMNDVSKGEGRTVLFVSHNLASIATLCNRSIVLSNGNIAFNGPITQGIDFYVNANNNNNSFAFKNDKPKSTDILAIRVLNFKNEPSLNHYYTDNVILEFDMQVDKDYKDAVLSIILKDQTERRVFASDFKLNLITSQSGKTTLRAIIPGNLLVPNRYIPIVAVHIPNREVISYFDNQVMFEIEETGSKFAQFTGLDYGCVIVDCKWDEVS